MQQILLFILLGLGSGALIAGIALAAVLMYRGSGIINLSTGAIAMLGGYAFWALDSGKLASLPVGVAVPLAVLFVLVVGALTEFAVYRPLRNSAPLAKLVASLGVLLIAQASMLLAFGVTPQPAPSILPQNTVHMLGAVVPVDRFILTGLVIVAAAALAALYRWTRFGLATRAASENEAAAMLSGLSPSVISLTNTLLASLVAGALGILAASITSLDPSTLPLQIIPALAAALIASFTSFGIAVAASLGIGIMYSLLEYASAQSWFPQSGGVSLPGVTDLLAFGIIIAVLFWRGSRIPGRGEIVERRLPEAPRPQHLTRTGLISGLAGAVLLIVFPFDFREALINTLIGALMALSLVVVTGFVGQISVVQLALAGAAGFTISHMAVNFGITFPVAALAGIAVAVIIGLVTAVSAVRVRGVSLAVVTLAGAVAIENFGFVNSTWGGGLAGSPVPEPKLFGLDLGPNAPFRGIDGNQPSPVFGWVALICCVLLCVAVGYIRRGTLERAGGGRGGDQPADRQAHRVRRFRAHRRRGRGAVRIQLRLGERRQVRRDDGAVADRVRLCGRHHAHLRRGVRRADLRAGADPVRARQVVRTERELVPAVRRRHPHLHAAAEPGGRGGRLLPADAQAARYPRAGGRRCRPRAPGPAHLPARPVRSPCRAAGVRPFGAVRRRARAQRRVTGGARGRARRAHRPERRRQDHPHRRDLRVRRLHRPGRAFGRGSGRLAAVPARPPRPGPHLAEHGTVRRPRRAREPDGRLPERVRRRSPLDGRHRLGGRGDADPAVFWTAQARRRRAGTGRQALGALPGRAGRRPGHRRKRGTRRLPAAARRRGPVDAAHRARHGLGARHLRPGGRPRIRQGHRRRAARDRPRGPARHRGIPR